MGTPPISASRHRLRGASRLAAVLAGAVAAGCGSEAPPASAPVPSADRPPVAGFAERTIPLPASPDAHVFRVPLDRATLTVVDVDHQPFSRLRVRERATLVVNSGFFDPSFEPEGLVVTEGVVRSAHVESLSGGVVWIRDHRASLAATEGFALPEGTDFAIQCRPRLVVDRAVNIASETGRRDARTALCVRDGGATLDVVIAPADGLRAPTLRELAIALAADGCEGALNLDGGPSTAAAWEGGSIEPVGPVRQAIVFRLER